jgi:hypothetical protein
MVPCGTLASAMWKLVLRLSVISLLSACQTSPPAGAEADAAAAGATMGGTGGAPGAVWPPPYLHSFVDYGTAHQPYGVAVGSEYVFWQQHGGYLMLVDKVSGGEPVKFDECPSCDFFNLAADGPHAYFLAGQEVRRYQPPSSAFEAAALDWDHRGGGAGFALDERFVYAAMPGCAAITRIDKQTLEKEVMSIEGVEYPGRGYTVLAKAGAGLLCASPSELFVVASWGVAKRVYTGFHELFGMSVAGERVAWLEQEGTKSAQIGLVSLDGSDAGVASTLWEVAGVSWRLRHVAALERTLLGTSLGIRGFDSGTSRIDKLVGIGAVVDFAVDDSAIYATLSGSRSHEVNGTLIPRDFAYWIARIPFAAFLDAPDGPPTGPCPSYTAAPDTCIPRTR